MSLGFLSCISLDASCCAMTLSRRRLGRGSKGRSDWRGGCGREERWRILRFVRMWMKTRECCDDSAGWWCLMVMIKLVSHQEFYLRRNLVGRKIAANVLKRQNHMCTPSSCLKLCSILQPQESRLDPLTETTVHCCFMSWQALLNDLDLFLLTSSKLFMSC